MKKFLIGGAITVGITLIITFIITIIVPVIMCIALFITIPSTDSDITKYLNHNTPIDLQSKEVMPNLEDLPNHEDKEYRYMHKMGAFPSESVVLVVEYDDKTYEIEKNKLDKRYMFLKEEVKTDWTGSEYVVLKESEFSINSYDFRVVGDDEEVNRGFVKSFGIIGVSDEKKSIAYLYYYDSELDSIGGSMSEFVKDYFDYDF